MEDFELDYETVRLAVNGSQSAQEKLLKHYDSYINALSMVEYEDDEGIIRQYVDEDMKAEIQTKYLEALPKCKVIK